MARKQTVEQMVEEQMQEENAIQNSIDDREGQIEYEEEVEDPWEEATADSRPSYPDADELEEDIYAEDDYEIIPEEERENPTPAPVEPEEKPLEDDGIDWQKTNQAQDANNPEVEEEEIPMEDDGVDWKKTNQAKGAPEASETVEEEENPLEDDGIDWQKTNQKKDGPQIEETAEEEKKPVEEEELPPPENKKTEPMPQIPKPITKPEKLPFDINDSPEELAEKLQMMTKLSDKPIILDVDNNQIESLPEAQDNAFKKMMRMDPNAFKDDMQGVNVYINGQQTTKEGLCDFIDAHKEAFVQACNEYFKENLKGVNLEEEIVKEAQGKEPQAQTKEPDKAQAQPAKAPEPQRQEVQPKIVVNEKPAPRPVMPQGPLGESYQMASNAVTHDMIKKETSRYFDTADKGHSFHFSIADRDGEHDHIELIKGKNGNNMIKLNGKFVEPTDRNLTRLMQIYPNALKNAINVELDYMKNAAYRGNDRNKAGQGKAQNNDKAQTTKAAPDKNQTKAKGKQEGPDR